MSVSKCLRWAAKTIFQVLDLCRLEFIRGGKLSNLFNNFFQRYEFHSTVCFPDGEAAKLQHRLQLLREEYQKLQARLAEVERENAMLSASSTSTSSSSAKSGKTFVAEILKKIAELLNKETYRCVAISC